MFSKRLLKRLSPLAVFVFAGSAIGQVVNWTGAVGPAWFDASQSGTCPNTQLQFFNNFGQIGCGGPVFPGVSNFVTIGAGTGPIINGDFTILGMSLAAGGTESWSTGNINFGTAPAGGFSNAGTFLLAGSADRNLYSSTIANSGLFRSQSPGLFYFQTVGMTNSGVLEWSRGTWVNYTGVNSLTSSGEIDKVSADTFNMYVPTTLSGNIDVQAGTLQFVNTSLLLQNTSTFAVQSGATLNFSSCTASGLMSGPLLGTGTMNIGGGFALGGNLTTDISGSVGLNWLANDWNCNAHTLSNTGVFTLSSAGDRSMYNGAIDNTGFFRSVSPGVFYFQTLAFQNKIGGDLQWSSGTWYNYTGTNSFVNNGTLEKFTAAAFSTNLPSTIAGTFVVHQGVMQFSTAPIEFQNPSTTIDAGATLNLNNTTLKGTFGASLGSGASVNLFGESYLSGDFNISVPGGQGFNWTNNGWNFQGHKLTNTALFTISQPADRSIYSAAIQNNGTFAHTTNAILYFQTANVVNPGTIEWQRGSWVNYTGPNSLSSAGTIKKTSPDSFTTNLPTTLSGLLDIQNGSTTFYSTTIDFQNPSNITIAPGTSLLLNNCTLRGKLKASVPNGTLSAFGDTSLGADLITQVTGGLGLNYTSGGMFFNGHTLTNNALLTISQNGDRSLYSGAIVNNATLESTNASILYFQTLAVSNAGTLRWHRGQWVNYTGPNSLSNTGTIEKVDPDAFAISVPSIFSGNLHVKQGSVAYNSAPLSFVGTSYTDVQFGSSLAFNSCSFTGIMPGSDGGPGTMSMNTFTLAGNFAPAIAGDEGLNWRSGDCQYNGHTLTNNGTLTFSGVDRSAYSGLLKNNAQFNSAINGGLLFQTFAINNSPGATVRWSAGDLISYTGPNSILNQGLFTKSGLNTRTISVAFENSGEFSVEQGTANVSSFTQDPGSTYRTTIYSGTDAGRLNAGNSLALKGNLAVYFLPLFSPATNQTWTVLSAPSISGTFDNVVPIAFPAGRQIGVTYTATSVKITLLAPGCVADLNHDGVVDDADFTLFIPAYNILDCADPSMPAGCPSDFNGDGIVDDQDFQLFVYAYDTLLCPE